MVPKNAANTCDARTKYCKPIKSRQCLQRLASLNSQRRSNFLVSHKHNEQITVQGGLLLWR